MAHRKSQNTQCKFLALLEYYSECTDALALAPPPAHAEPCSAHHGPSVAIPMWWPAVSSVSSVVVPPFNKYWAWAVRWSAIGRVAAWSSKSETHYGLWEWFQSFGVLFACFQVPE